MGALIETGLIFGCYGLSTEEDFCVCRGVENKIIYFHHLDEKVSDNVIEFIIQSCGLIHGDISDYNKITNMISYLHKNYEIFSKSELHNIQLFIKTHKLCGLYIRLFEEETQGEIHVR